MNCSKLHLLRHPGDNGREEINQQDSHHHEEEHGQGGFGDPKQIFASHALQYEQVKADRRRDLRHLNDQDNEDAKPQGVNARFLNGGHDHAHGQNDHGDAI